MSKYEELIAVAAKDIGYTESPPDSNRTKYGEWYGVNGVAWCMEAVQYWHNRIGKKLPYKTASCSGLLNWYKANKPANVHSEPKPGYIIIFNFGHTGIVVEEKKNTIITIEGNTSSSDKGSQDNGGGVYKRERKKSLVTAYIDGIDEVEETVIEEDEDMTVERFAELMQEYRATLQDNDSGDWSKEARDWATSTGFINGVGNDANGNPNYAWADGITREQAAMLFYRFAKMMGKA